MFRKANKRPTATGRSQPKKEQYILLSHKMISSPEFCSLSPSSIKVLLGLCLHHNGFNNGKIVCSYEQLAKLLKLGKATVSKALERLEATQFLVCTRRGFFTGRQASEWEVTFLKSDGYYPTNLWNKNLANDVVKGFQKKTKNENHLLSEVSEDIASQRIGSKQELKK